MVDQHVPPGPRQDPKDRRHHEQPDPQVGHGRPDVDRDGVTQRAVDGAGAQRRGERENRPQHDVFEDRHAQDQRCEAGVDDPEGVEDVRDHGDRRDRDRDREHEHHGGLNAVGTRQGLQRQERGETEAEQERQGRAADQEPRRRPPVLLRQHPAGGGPGDEHQEQQAEVVEKRDHARGAASRGAEQAAERWSEPAQEHRPDQDACEDFADDLGLAHADEQIADQVGGADDQHQGERQGSELVAGHRGAAPRREEVSPFMISSTPSIRPISRSPRSSSRPAGRSSRSAVRVGIEADRRPGLDRQGHRDGEHVAGGETHFVEHALVILTTIRAGNACSRRRVRHRPQYYITLY